MLFQCCVLEPGVPFVVLAGDTRAVGYLDSALPCGFVQLHGFGCEVPREFYGEPVVLVFAAADL